MEGGYGGENELNGVREQNESEWMDGQKSKSLFGDSKTNKS